jgi:hypothetical protein
MANKWLKRLEIGYPQQPNPRYMYSVKLFEQTSLALLQADVNEFLFTLPDTTQIWSPHLIDTQLLTYTSVVGPPVTIFVMKVTLYISGTQLTPPVP